MNSAFRNAPTYSYLGEIHSLFIWKAIDDELPKLRLSLITYKEEHYE